MEKLRIYCQSCGRPLKDERDYGTNPGGQRTSEYCNRCYCGGRFIDPDITLEQMILRVAKDMNENMGMSQQEAANVAVTVIPRLKRWRYK